MNTNRWDAIAREGNKRSRLGQYAHCQLCHEEDPRCLRQIELGARGEERIAGTLCAGCHVQLQGKPPTEQHHPSARSNDTFTVSVPANEHAILTDWQHDWPVATLRNPDGSPLLAAAAALRGWLDLLRLIVERTVGWIPGFLEWLDGVLRSQVADRWWETLGWEGELA